MAMGSDFYVRHGRHGPTAKMGNGNSGSTGWHGGVLDHSQNGKWVQGSNGLAWKAWITAKWQWRSGSMAGMEGMDTAKWAMGSAFNGGGRKGWITVSQRYGMPTLGLAGLWQ